MARAPIETWCFALVAVRRNREWLLVHERKPAGGWFLPAGRVEPGESFIEAAHRETLEEAGVPIVIEGILRIEHTPMSGGTARMRVLFAARAADDTPPKTEPDAESLGAGWFTVDDMRALPMRGPEVIQMFEDVERGAPVFPMTLLAVEGTPLLP